MARVAAQPASARVAFVTGVSRGLGEAVARGLVAAGWRVTGIGPDVTYTFMCGKTPISTELKYFREFDVENRATGNSGFLNVTVPLSVGH